jgi:ankyrin repeat protein
VYNSNVTSQFVDPRESPLKSKATVSARTTTEPTALTELHRMCRENRIYDVERWIASGTPLQIAAASEWKGQTTSALEIALEARNHALVLLLLCNGYDPNLERKCPLDLALRSRRWDLLDLLLEWGADPKSVSVGDLFDSYNSKLFERFRELGVDLTAGHELAYALGYHTSNKPLFGYVKHHRDDPKIQKELDIALAHHAKEENEKGVQLCLWAGANPHAAVPDLQYPALTDDEDDTRNDGEEPFLGWTAIQEACQAGHAKIVERLGPDPAQDNFDDLFRFAGSAAVVELLLARARPNNVGEILQRQLWWFPLDSHSYGRGLDIIQSIFKSGVRWETDRPEQIANVRKALLKLSNSSFVDVMKLLARESYCSDAILQELGRTPNMRARMKAVGFIPTSSEKSRAFDQPRPTRSREVLARFNIVLPKPPPAPLPRWVVIGNWRRDGREIRLTRRELFERVWSEPVEKLAKEWGLSGRGLGKACAKMQIPVPPRGFWAKAEHGHKVRRPGLPDLKPGEAEVIVIHAPL